MTLKTRTGETIPLSRSVLDGARILIICDDAPVTDLLTNTFLSAGLIVERATNLTEGCESARSGRVQVVFTKPFLKDGSWKRLVELSSHQDVSFVVVILASDFNVNEWAEALKDGAFDVLDPQNELPRAAEAAKRALWAAYHKAQTPMKERAGSKGQREH